MHGPAGSILLEHIIDEHQNATVLPMATLSSWRKQRSASGSRWSRYARGYMWYSLALSNGEKTVGIYRAKPAKKMTPAQIAEAERLAKEWKPDPSACDTGAATSSPMN